MLNIRSCLSIHLCFQNAKFIIPTEAIVFVSLYCFNNVTYFQRFGRHMPNLRKMIAEWYRCFLRIIFAQHNGLHLPFTISDWLQNYSVCSTWIALRNSGHFVLADPISATSASHKRQFLRHISDTVSANVIFQR
jgi:hypothetical protein